MAFVLRFRVPLDVDTVHILPQKCCACQHLFAIKKKAMRRPRSYHHGNLKQALLEASLDLIRKAGAGAFTLREVARRAGVSHNAPYRHFRDKEELLAALAAEGFDRLTAAMTKAAESAIRRLGALSVERARLRGICAALSSAFRRDV